MLNVSKGKADVYLLQRFLNNVRECFSLKVKLSLLFSQNTILTSELTFWLMFKRLYKLNGCMVHAQLFFPDLSLVITKSCRSFRKIEAPVEQSRERSKEERETAYCVVLVGKRQKCMSFKRCNLLGASFLRLNEKMQFTCFTICIRQKNAWTFFASLFFRCTKLHLHVL